MGKIVEGDTLFIDYTFTNTGEAPLIISNYEVACSCTEVIFPQEPILPGKEGNIKVSFDSDDKIGYQDRTISLYSNAPNSPFKIRFTVSVKKE